MDSDTILCAAALSSAVLNLVAAFLLGTHSGRVSRAEKTLADVAEAGADVAEAGAETARLNAGLAVETAKFCQTTNTRLASLETRLMGGLIQGAPQGRQS